MQNYKQFKMVALAGWDGHDACFMQGARLSRAPSAAQACPGASNKGESLMIPFREDRRHPLTVAILVICLAFAFGGCGPVGTPSSFEDVAAVPPDHSTPDGIVRSFLARVGTARFAQAYDVISPRAREDVSLEEFVGLHAQALDGAILERFDIKRLTETGPGQVDVHVSYQILIGEDHRHTLEKTYSCVSIDGGWWVDYKPTKRLQPTEGIPEEAPAASAPAAGA
jgi:hypothetical protein